jgi:hypothetical protein
MNDSSEKDILDLISAAGPKPEIFAAMDGNYTTAGIISETYADNLLGSKLFNVATAAMGVLRREPLTPLIEKTIEVPDSIASIGSYTLEILNRSLIAQSERKTLNIKNKTPLPEQDLSASHETWLMEAINEQDDKKRETSLLLIDEAGCPILFQAPETAVNLKTVRINLVPFPPGSIIDLNTKTAISEVIDRQTNTRIAMAKRSNIVSAAALRFSMFTFSPQERLGTLFQPLDVELHQIPIPNEILDYKLSDLKSKLPSNETRKLAAKILINRP